MLFTFRITNLIVLIIYGGQAHALTIPFVPVPLEILKAEGIKNLPKFTSLATPASGNPIDRSAWTVTVDSFEPSDEAINVLDGNNQTFWHSEWSQFLAPLPHTIIFDMKNIYNVDGLSYQGRQDTVLNGNIGEHQIFVSIDGIDFGSPVAIGTYLDDYTTKYTAFETTPARYLQIVALTEAGNRGPWTSAAEINVYDAGAYTPPPSGLGKWGPTIDFPMIPVAATLDHNTGKVLTWSSRAPSSFASNNGGLTVTATYDPTSGTVTGRTVTNTGHDMFCPGISLDFNGRPIVTGGVDNKTSIYDQDADAWMSGPTMLIGRGYQSSATCSDGRIFVIGGSWGQPIEGNKTGEILDPVTNTWTALPNCLVLPMQTADKEGVYRADNHAWLFGWKNGYVFQAGPSAAMNWYSTDDTSGGGQSSAGPRAADPDAMCGNAVMYDAVNGKILTLGGSPNYSGSPSTTAAHIITLGNSGDMPLVTQVNSMNSNRIFGNAVVLPNGQVFITGGQSFSEIFSDDYAQLTPELWDPITEVFTQLVSNSIARNYHSVALLLQDGTVLSAGGGLCGPCSANHFDGQVYTPQYLLNPDGSLAARPNILSVSAATVAVGGTFTVQMDSAVDTMSLIRYGSTTHAVNTDQRRVPLQPVSAGGNAYSVVIPSDPGIALPGYWMLFAINLAGVPSVAQTILITP